MISVKLPFKFKLKFILLMELQYLVIQTCQLALESFSLFWVVHAEILLGVHCNVFC